MEKLQFAPSNLLQFRLLNSRRDVMEETIMVIEMVIGIGIMIDVLLVVVCCFIVAVVMFELWADEV